MRISDWSSDVCSSDLVRNQARGFKPADLTPQELADCISQGYAFSYQFENSHRKADNFICSDIIAADFDAGMTLDEALANDFFINNANRKTFMKAQTVSVRVRLVGRRIIKKKKK